MTSPRRTRRQWRPWPTHIPSRRTAEAGNCACGFAATVSSGCGGVSSSHQAAVGTAVQHHWTASVWHWWNSCGMWEAPYRVSRAFAAMLYPNSELRDSADVTTCSAYASWHAVINTALLQTAHILYMQCNGTLRHIGTNSKPNHCQIVSKPQSETQRSQTFSQTLSNSFRHETPGRQPHKKTLRRCQHTKAGHCERRRLHMQGPVLAQRWRKWQASVLRNPKELTADLTQVPVCGLQSGGGSAARFAAAVMCHMASMTRITGQRWPTESKSLLA